ncbi:MAG: hypothetical protein LAT54_04235, partial [Cryomorphaceae bacterium]|nr:hypothetical protein [Cryomorphaceae bacterium]
GYNNSNIGFYMHSQTRPPTPDLRLYHPANIAISEPMRAERPMPASAAHASMLAKHSQTKPPNFQTSKQIQL